MAELSNVRRDFLKKSGVLALGASLQSFDTISSKKEELIILHTNDVHSHIHPFELNHPKYAGLGGVVKRAELIESYRLKHKNVLLLDAGDMFQGTPFFNFYGGELEIKLMSHMKYDAGTLGNHDFDGGVHGLMKAMTHSNFPLLNSNYILENDLKKIVKPYKIFKKGRIKVGVFGIGLELEGLVSKNLCQGTIFTDPIHSAKKTSDILKEKYHCDYIICLSHLGYKYGNEKVSDILLARNTKNIDLIIGGHTHSFLNEPTKELNIEGKKVLISQAAWAGLRLGVIKVLFTDNKPIAEGTSEKIGI